MQQNALLKNSMLYGAYLGLSLILVSVLFYSLSFENGIVSMLVNYAVLIVWVAVGTISFRDNKLNGFLSYGKAYTSGILIIIFGAFITSIYMYFFVTVIEPDFMNKVIEKMTEDLQEQGKSAEEIDMAVSWTKKFSTPLMLTFMTFIGQVFWGALLNLIVAIFLKKKDNRTAGPTEL